MVTMTKLGGMLNRADTARPASKLTAAPGRYSGRPARASAASTPNSCPANSADNQFSAALGEIETFRTLLHRAHDIDLTFWRAWYFGRIPWERKTVAPASMLLSPRLQRVFDGYVS